MSNGVQQIFREHVHTVESRSGLSLPPLVKLYVAEVLMYYIDKPEEISPEHPYAIRLREITSRIQAKQIGDELLWVSGVLGSPRRRYGVTREYYCELGSQAYSMTESDTLHTIADHFRVVSDFVRIATRDCPRDYF